MAEAIDLIQTYSYQLHDASTLLNRSELMGVEGICARTYYQALRYWFPPQWNFTGRNRRPPLDPINALMSWGYGVLLARVFSACVQVGLDPYLCSAKSNISSCFRLPFPRKGTETKKGADKVAFLTTLSGFRLPFPRKGTETI